MQTKTLKYQWLAEQLRQHIRSGELKSGDRLPSWSEIQSSYGVNKYIIERAQKELIAEGLLVSHQGKGTFVSEPGKAAPKSTGIIGLSGHVFSFNGFSYYWSQIMGGVRDAAAAAGFQVLLLDHNSFDGWEKADGVLLCDWNDPDGQQKRPPALPYVSLLTPIQSMASVVADDETGMREATEHLIELGHRKISYLHAYDGAIMQNRMAGYRAALKTAGITPSKQWTRYLGGHYFFGAQFTYEANIHMKRWLLEGWRDLGCTAILCHNDEAALGVIQTLNEEGIRVPQDVSVVGFDGTEYCDLVSPKISSVQLPLREIGAVGVELLLQQIARDEVSQEHRVLPVQLRPRESTTRPTHNL